MTEQTQIAPNEITTVGDLEARAAAEALIENSDFDCTMVECLQAAGFVGNVFNQEWDHDDVDNVTCRADFAAVISNRFIMSIRPQIFDGKFEVYVCLNNMKDGLGIGSSNYEVANNGDSEETLEFEKDTLLTEVWEKSRAKAMEFHVDLLVSVGLEHNEAENLAAEYYGES